MPFDALFLTAVRRELESSLTGCRVDKVQQPQRDTLILSMRGAAGGGKLLLTASPNHPRIHLTNEPAENPAQPPMFCMLLRKHLTGGRLVGTSPSTAPTRWEAPRKSTSSSRSWAATRT